LQGFLLTPWALSIISTSVFYSNKIEGVILKLKVTIYFNNFLTQNLKKIFIHRIFVTIKCHIYPLWKFVMMKYYKYLLREYLPQSEYS
jgi:hypothetical protein